MKHTLVCGNAKAMVEDQGAELISFYNTKEYLWQADPNYWGGFSPVLFPNPSTLMNDTIRIEGKEYHIPKHGFVRGKAFTVVQKTENSICLSYTSNTETLAMYPYPFVLYVTHTITEQGFTTAYRVQNIGNSTMHFCIGGHPSFNCPLNKGEAFEDYALVFEYKENAKAYYTAGGKYMDRDLYWHRLNNTDTWNLKHADFEKDSSIFENLKSSYVSLVHKHTGEGVRVHFGNFPALVVWTKDTPSSPFLCIEPWQGVPALKDESGNFEDKAYAIHLPMGEEYTASFQVEIL
ncbi:MAG: aldose 1-epimerase family protein [Eubacteriales bacterium]|nr:aldose 1-epimerase family protein [Eubacteriales bacterium]